MTTTTPEETQAISRLRALGQGVRVYCLTRDQSYCVPASSGDGSAYQVLVSSETTSCSCPAGTNDKYCKHVTAVEMYREAQAQLEQATSMAVTVGLHDALERSLEQKLGDLY